MGGAAEAKAGKKAAAAQDQMRQYEYSQQLGQAKWQDEYNKRMFAHLADLPNLQKLEMGPVTQGLRQFVAQRKFMPQLEDFTSQMNEGYRKEISKIAPEFYDSFAQTGKNAAAWSRGEIDKDVQEAVMRGAAQGALAGGYGTQSGMFQNRVARDFGLTSLNLKEKAAGMMPMLSQVASQNSPYKAANFLFTPQQIQDRIDTQTMTNWQVGNQNLEREYIRDSPLPPSYAKYMAAPPNIGYTGPSASSMALSAGLTAFGGALAGGASSMGQGGGGMSTGQAAPGQPVKGGYTYTQAGGWKPYAV